MSLVTEEKRADASEIYIGKEICQEKSKQFLKEMGLPTGLLPLEDMEECGIVKDTGFIWLKQKQKTMHKFDKIGKTAHYAAEITAYVEPKKLKQVTGIKTKELFIWITVTDVNVDVPSTGKLTFKTPTGMSRVFPVSAFEVTEPDDEEVKGNKE
ncbi:hypothetical protein ACH5RR_001663 [Cinchona calisaya]|uniref:DUF538 domain-containing protein n=1 Tax=Cinchona calisaya TaxID=153742 RepID=A0ABD3B415_9GENT